MAPGHMYESKKVAEYLGISPRSVVNLVHRGELRGYMICGRLRFKYEDIQNYLDNQVVGVVKSDSYIPSLTEKPHQNSPYKLPKPAFA